MSLVGALHHLQPILSKPHPLPSNIPNTIIMLQKTSPKDPILLHRINNSLAHPLVPRERTQAEFAGGHHERERPTVLRAEEELDLGGEGGEEGAGEGVGAGDWGVGFYVGGDLGVDCLPVKVVVS